MEKRNYLKPEIHCNKVETTQFIAGSKGKGSAENVGLNLIDNYYHLELNGDHDVSDDELWAYLTTNNSITLCADNGGTLSIGDQTFTIDNNYSYEITKGDSICNNNECTYYFDVNGTGETCGGWGDWGEKDWNN